MTPAQIVTKILSLLTLASDIVIVVLLLSFLFGIFKLGQGTGKKIIRFFSRHAYVFAYIVAFASTAGSLFYSEIARYTPCKLCWYQRIFMYPQVLLLGMALYKKDKNIADYIIGLSAIGGLIAIYHYLLQIGVIPVIKCGEVGVSVSCSDRFSLSFGYITIPMMALTAFVINILLMLSTKLAKRK